MAATEQTEPPRKPKRAASVTTAADLHRFATLLRNAGADKLAITEIVAGQGIFYLAPTPVGGAITISGLKLTGASKPRAAAKKR